MTAPVLAAGLMALGEIDPGAMSVEAARRAWDAYRAAHGLGKGATFTMPGTCNSKLAKSPVPTVSLTLAPWKASGVNVCPAATVECRGACVLMTAGRGTFPNVRAARVLRTRFLAEHPHAAVTLTASEIEKAARRYGDVIVRLNVASDLPWERLAPALFSIAGARFYDYTKLDPATRGIPGRYRIVYSYAGRQSERRAADYLGSGGTVAVVFATPRGEALPRTWRGFPVLDGDLSDDRTSDPAAHVVGLRAKGAAVGMTPGGFVQRHANS